MNAVLPAIDGRPDVIRAYAGADPAPVGPYRSDGTEPISRAEVQALIASTVESELAAR
jgi:hypothetical protein